MRRSGISDEREARLDIRWQFTKITRRHSPILVRALSLLSVGLTSCPSLLTKYVPHLTVSYWQNTEMSLPVWSGRHRPCLNLQTDLVRREAFLGLALPPSSLLPPPSLPYWHEIDIYQATTWLYIQALTVDTISHPVTALYGQLNRMRVSKLSFHFKV